jgi:hypothetical protein
MSVVKNPENWDLTDCIEDCHYASRFCYTKDDGTMVCPSERSCADECRERFSS